MKKVLIIDDETSTLAMFKLFLGALGYEAMTASSGAEGVEIFKAESPSIIMTDIKMPGMDGFGVLKSIKAIDPGAEIIVITGHGDTELAQQALSLNATDFINKPINKDSLESALARAEDRLSKRGL